jgi:hypothetical protein
LDRITHADPPACQYLRAQAALVDEGAKYGLARQIDEVLAWFAQAGAPGENFANPEKMIDQPIEGDTAGRQIPTRLARREVDSVFVPQSLKCLGLDQGQIAAHACVTPVTLASGVAISDEARTGDDVGYLQRTHRSPSLCGKVDMLETSDGGHRAPPPEAARANPANNRLTQGRSSISSGCHCTAIRKRRSSDSSDSITPSSDVPVTLSGGATVFTAW